MVLLIPHGILNNLPESSTSRLTNNIFISDGRILAKCYLSSGVPGCSLAVLTSLRRRRRGRQRSGTCMRTPHNATNPALPRADLVHWIFKSYPPFFGGLSQVKLPPERAANSEISFGLAQAGLSTGRPSFPGAQILTRGGDTTRLELSTAHSSPELGPGWPGWAVGRGGQARRPRLLISI